MRPWIQRTLIGAVSATALIVSIGAYSQDHAGGPGWHMNGGDPVAMRAHMLERVGKQLDLDATQKQRLGALADALHQEHSALMGSGGDPRAQMQELIAGTTFDRQTAQALITAKATAMQQYAPALIAAAGDFYDTLRPDQQQKVRDFMNKRHGHPG